MLSFLVGLLWQHNQSEFVQQESEDAWATRQHPVTWKDTYS